MDYFTEADKEELISQLPSGGGDNWELIQKVTIAEGVAKIEITQDAEGNPFSLKKYNMKIKAVGATDNASAGYLFVTSRSNEAGAEVRLASIPTGAPITNRTTYVMAKGEVFGNRVDVICSGSAHQDGVSEMPLYHMAQFGAGAKYQYNNGIRDFSISTSKAGFGAGTEIELWGVRL